jgi:cytochrome c-type biogenesis protein CcmH/NrfG
MRYGVDRVEIKSGGVSADVEHMAVVAALLFLCLAALGLALAGAGVYYLRVLRPRLESQAAPTSAKESHETDTLATFVEQLQELARLRDQGILTSREFTSKKAELLERI